MGGQEGGAKVFELRHISGGKFEGTQITLILLLLLLVSTVGTGQSETHKTCKCKRKQRKKPTNAHHLDLQSEKK